MSSCTLLFQTSQSCKAQRSKGAGEQDGNEREKGGGGNRKSPSPSPSLTSVEVGKMGTTIPDSREQEPANHPHIFTQTSRSLGIKP